jgi:hypothetical protein
MRSELQPLLPRMRAGVQSFVRPIMPTILLTSLCSVMRAFVQSVEVNRSHHG